MSAHDFSERSIITAKRKYGLLEVVKKARFYKGGKGAEMNRLKRHGNRVACEDKCLLVYKGKNYPCILENISVSGALLICSDLSRNPVKSGEACGILLCSDPALCPNEYKSRVARHDAAKIALQFIGA